MKKEDCGKVFKHKEHMRPDIILLDVVLIEDIDAVYETHCHIKYISDEDEEAWWQYESWFVANYELYIPDKNEIANIIKKLEL